VFDPVDLSECTRQHSQTGRTERKQRAIHGSHRHDDGKNMLAAFILLELIDASRAGRARKGDSKKLPSIWGRMVSKRSHRRFLTGFSNFQIQ
jgi:hypothetical protein